MCQILAQNINQFFNLGEKIFMTNPFSGIVRDSDYERWINQFELEDQDSIIKLLDHFHYFSSDKVFELLNELYKKLVAEFNIDEKTTLFVPVGYIAKSGAAISYFFRRENNLSEESFIALKDIEIADFHRLKNIVFLDDFIGTGEYIDSIKKDLILKLPENIRNRVNFICACVVGYQQGIDKVRDDLLKVCSAYTIRYNEQPLHSKSSIFSKNEKKKILEVLYKYNSQLKPNSPMGYGSIMGLVSFFFATPNNTLPIFWSSKDDWYPLFPRGDSRRNPNNLITLPDFLLEYKIFSTKFNSKIKYSEETTKSLFDSFLSLDKMNIMSEVFNQLNIDDKLILQVTKVIDSCQNMKHENKNICTAILILGEKEEIDKNILVAEAENVSLLNIKLLKNHLSVINGWANTLLVNNNGEALGIMKYVGGGLDSNTSVSKDKYRAFELTTSLHHGLLIVFTDDDRVLLYYNGERLMTKKGKDWHIQGNLKNISEVALSHDIIPDVLNKAIKFAFKLSDLNYGGLLCIGDENKVIMHSKPMGQLNFKYRDNNLLKVDEESFLSIASQDGAVLISSKGDIIKYMQRLEPSGDINIPAEEDKGTRHNTAKKMSAITKAVYITVSSDGPISIYVDGERIMRMLG